MQHEDIIPFRPETTEGKNLFPGAVDFVETFDTEEDVSEPADILSFESLRNAFAMIQSAETELDRAIPEGEPTPEIPERPNYGVAEADDSENESEMPSLKAEPYAAVGIRLETIMEALLFVGNRENRPLDAGQIAEKLRNVSAEDVDQAAVHLNRLYQERDCPYTIISERGGYRMVLRSEFESVRSNFHGKIRDTRLSQQAVDTLAVVAYRQPITADEIQNLRQQSCSTVLTQLVRRNLLSQHREGQDKKSAVRYRTTSRFLELLQIPSLDEIPKAEEIDYR
ncbi:MAG: SMC-Scp complex subunit ScpB [Planctomycetaceae bacterium]|jgi:segregation and condensation protein B|nr:SMC-Scp complex subunit ScpB [Planctomycetaceae bacterium]